MSTLPDELFSLVEKLILAAREAAETAAETAINNLAVNRAEPYSSMDESARKMRRTLRAKARQLGGGSQTEGLQPLIEEMAYQQWHRMLFARFLAENDLLIHPSGVAVSLEDCAELSPEENEADAWAVAAKYASSMLPGIFRLDDPVVSVRFAPEGQLQLERILDELPGIVFITDDSLGWMYQFWQAKKKKEVNDSERKIEGADLAPVTQLFTENYMVRFLLENSMGAWWAGKQPDSPLLKDYEYLRYKKDGTPVVGVFEGWPKTAAEVTVMDPCCGSGHFLVAAFELLREMRMAEEGLDAREAGDAVLKDNLHGLELDLRATQIAAFSVTLVAWKTGGYRNLPMLNIACSGTPVQGSLESWLKSAADDERLKQALNQLYQLFENASSLGSLIDPNMLNAKNPMFVSGIHEIKQFFSKKSMDVGFDEIPDFNLYLKAGSNVATLFSLLSGKYTLIITNVPFLTNNKQAEVLTNFCEEYFPISKTDLATTFLERCRRLTSEEGTYAIITPHDWRFLVTYKNLRKKYLEEQKWDYIVNLGGKAFRTPMWDFNVGFSILSNTKPKEEHEIQVLDISSINDNAKKALTLKGGESLAVSQIIQFRNPDSMIIFDEQKNLALLGNYIESYTGIQTGDDPKYRRCFWELEESTASWRRYLNTVSTTKYYGGREHVLWWKNNGEFYESNPQAYIRGVKAWGKTGVSISQMGSLPITMYLGEPWIMNCATIIPKKTKNLLAIWAFCSSDEFNTSVRKINQANKVNPGYFKKIPFDLDRWQKVAEEEYPDGLPEPYSNDPTQWLFKGDLTGSAEPLQVAVSRLLGYRWPEQERDNLDGFVDEDGIVPLVSAGREIPAADRLRELLDVAYGSSWSAEKQAKLLADVDFVGKSLEDWLRDGFFNQHVKLFKNRPFIWHIWDGRKDGFHALVNYHKLDTAALDRLIYTYLGSWIELQRGQRNFGEPGADGRLVAALELKEKLEAIREGQPPYDIYVRWKTLAEQSISWNPDLNDGVRLNIRPFVTAGVLRNKFTVHWKKDRGKNPDGSERLNDLHYSNEEKLAAR